MGRSPIGVRDFRPLGAPDTVNNYGFGPLGASVGHPNRPGAAQAQKWPESISKMAVLDLPGDPSKMIVLGFTEAFPGAKKHTKTDGFRPLGVKTT